eukprot:scaffold1869_cov163-Ochromonas_danica.AAC.27
MKKFDWKARESSCDAVLDLVEVPGLFLEFSKFRYSDSSMKKNPAGNESWSHNQTIDLSSSHS